MTTAQKLFCIAAASLSLSACATLQRTDLFFGTDIPGGGQVSAGQWKNFSDSVIAARFPEGFTEWEAQGRWLDKDTRQTITEPTRVVTFIGRKGKARNAALDTIIREYIRRYRQQAVLRLDARTRVRFISAKQSLTSAK